MTDASNEKKTLAVRFKVWGRPGRNVAFRDRRRQLRIVENLDAAREYAHEQGYSGIRVKPE